MTVPAVADELVDAYLHAVDADVGGLVEGLYLIGSAALGDFRPHSSDIDFVAVDRGRPAALKILTRAGMLALCPHRG